jgi:hypothetical protein
VGYVIPGLSAGRPGIPLSRTRETVDTTSAATGGRLQGPNSPSAAGAASLHFVFERSFELKDGTQSSAQMKHPSVTYITLSRDISGAEKAAARSGFVGGIGVDAGPWRSRQHRLGLIACHVVETQREHDAGNRQPCRQDDDPWIHSASPQCALSEHKPLGKATGDMTIPLPLLISAVKKGHLSDETGGGLAPGEALQRCFVANEQHRALQDGDSQGAELH